MFKYFEGELLIGRAYFKAVQPKKKYIFYYFLKIINISKFEKIFCRQISIISRKPVTSI